MARPWIEFLFAQHLPWLQGLPGGARDDVAVKFLSRDVETGACSLLVKYPPGWQRAGAEVFSTDEELYVLDGALSVDGQICPRDSYVEIPAGAVRKNVSAPQGCVALTFYDATPAKLPAAQGDESLAPRVIDVLAMRWDASVADPTLAWMGIRRKVLRWDNVYDQKGTFLLSLPPHIYPDNWQCPTLTHPCVEEAFQLTGDTIGPHGRMTPGAYFWRPADIPHGPFGSRDGGLSLIRFKHGKHVNVWDDKNLPYSFDAPYRPMLPPDLASIAKPYDGTARF